MKGLALTPRAMAAATALPLLFLSATQCSTAFVLRVSSLSRALVHDGERPTTAPASATTAHRSRATALGLSPNAPQPEKRRGGVISLMMAAGPAEEEGVAEEAAAAADEPPVPEGGGTVTEEEEGEGARELELEGDEASGVGETEVVAEGEGEEEEEVDPMAEVKQQIKVGFV